MWRAIAYAEYVHARNHFKALGHLGSIQDNLQQSIEGENFEVQEMYPVYNNAAKFQNENEAVRTTHFALEAEKKFMKNGINKLKKQLKKKKILKKGKFIFVMFVDIL